MVLTSSCASIAYGRSAHFSRAPPVLLLVLPAHTCDLPFSGFLTDQDARPLADDPKGYRYTPADWTVPEKADVYCRRWGGCD